MRYNITPHCKSRYIERVLNQASSDNLFVEIIKNLDSGENITSKISNECPRFILYVKEKYEFNINIIEKDGIIYILRKDKNTSDTYSVLTCYVKHRFLEQFKNSVLSNDEVYHRLKMLKKNK